LIREGKTFQIQSIIQTGRGQGMVSMNDALLDLVRAGVIDAEAALDKAPSRVEFKALLDRAAGTRAGTPGVATAKA
jgi:twitching motility protein PilT